MTQEDVLKAISTLNAVFTQYLSDVPQTQRLQERAAIRLAVDQFLNSSFTALPPDTQTPPSVCPRCNGTGKI
jgi:hypothetical protein